MVHVSRVMVLGVLAAMAAFGAEVPEREFVVNYTEDPTTFSYDDELVSLREAIQYAQDHTTATNVSGTRTITFADALATNGMTSATYEPGDTTEVIFMTRGITLSEGVFPYERPLKIEGNTRYSVVMRAKEYLDGDSYYPENGFMFVGLRNCVHISGLTFRTLGDDTDAKGYGWQSALVVDGTDYDYDERVLDIACPTTILKVTNCRFTDCWGGYPYFGGAINVQNASLMVINSTFDRNGGVFDGNINYGGAAIWANSSRPAENRCLYVAGCVFSQNRYYTLATVYGTDIYIGTLYDAVLMQNTIYQGTMTETELNKRHCTYYYIYANSDTDLSGSLLGGIGTKLNTATLYGPYYDFGSSFANYFDVADPAEPAATFYKGVWQLYYPLKQDSAYATGSSVVYYSEDGLEMRYGYTEGLIAREYDLVGTYINSEVSSFGACQTDTGVDPDTVLEVTTLEDIVDEKDKVLSLREALEYISLVPSLKNPDGTVGKITFASSLFANGKTTIKLTEGLVMPGLANRMTNEIHICGPADATLVLDGGGKYPILTQSDLGPFRLSRITLQNGYAGTSGLGGAVKAVGRGTFENCIFKENTAVSGSAGAVMAINGEYVFRNCRFEGNTSPSGAAIWFNGNAWRRILMDNGDFKYMTHSLIDNCTFYENTGSAACISTVSNEEYQWKPEYDNVKDLPSWNPDSRAHLTFVNNSFVDNSAALEMGNAHVTMINCTARRNGSGSSYWAILSKEATDYLLLVNSIISDNNAQDVYFKSSTLSYYSNAHHNYQDTDLITGEMRLVDSCIGTRKFDSNANANFFYYDEYYSRGTETYDEVSRQALGAAEEDVFLLAGSSRVVSETEKDGIRHTIDELNGATNVVTTGIRVWRDEDYANVTVSNETSGASEVLIGVATNTLAILAGDISERDRSTWTPSMGCYWVTYYAASEGALVVTTLADTVDDTDGRTSLREIFEMLRTATLETLVSLRDEEGKITISFLEGLEGDDGAEDNLRITIIDRQMEVSCLPTETIRLKRFADENRHLVFDGNGTHRALRIWPGTRLEISGVVFENGYGETIGLAPQPGTSGGAIINNGTLTLDDCVFLNNTAGGSRLMKTVNGEGGALWLGSGATTIVTRCSFAGNRASRGGGIAGDGQLTLYACTFVTNVVGVDSTATYAGVGGGLYFPTGEAASGQDALLMNCTFTGNQGGGIYAYLPEDVTRTIFHAVNTVAVGNTDVNGNADDLNVVGDGAFDLVSSLVGSFTTNNTPYLLSDAATIYPDMTLAGTFANLDLQGKAIPTRESSGVGHFYVTLNKAIADIGEAADVTYSEDWANVYAETEEEIILRGRGGRYKPETLVTPSGDQLGRTAREVFYGAVSKYAIATHYELTDEERETGIVRMTEDVTWTGISNRLVALATLPTTLDRVLEVTDATCAVEAGGCLEISGYTDPNHPLTIRGLSARYSSSEGRRFFHVAADCHVCFDGVTLKNGGDVDACVEGGAILAEDGVELTCTNCVFRNNAAQYGGAVCALGETILTFASTTFMGNVASVEGDNVWQNLGVMNVGRCTIADGTFSGEAGVREDVYTITTAAGMAFASLTVTEAEQTLEEETAVGSRVTCISMPADVTAAEAAEQDNLSATLEEAYAGQDWYSVTRQGSQVAATLNEEAAPTIATLQMTGAENVSKRAANRVTVTLENLKPGLWYQLESTDDLDGTWTAISATRHQAQEGETSITLSTSRTDDTAQFYRVRVSEE